MADEASERIKVHCSAIELEGQAIPLPVRSSPAADSTASIETPTAAKHENVAQYLLDRQRDRLGALDGAFHNHMRVALG